VEVRGARWGEGDLPSAAAAQEFAAAARPRAAGAAHPVLASQSASKGEIKLAHGRDITNTAAQPPKQPVLSITESIVLVHIKAGVNNAVSPCHPSASILVGQSASSRSASPSKGGERKGLSSLA
jgi:hypothetical protein